MCLDVSIDDRFHFLSPWYQYVFASVEFSICAETAMSMVYDVWCQFWCVDFVRTYLVDAFVDFLCCWLYPVLHCLILMEVVEVAAAVDFHVWMLIGVMVAKMGMTFCFMIRSAQSPKNLNSSMDLGGWLLYDCFLVLVASVSDTDVFLIDS